MHCVNHPEADVQSYCQSCGKPLCANCVRTGPNGQIVCESCLATPGVDANQAYWQAFVTPPRGVPNPSVAAVLGLIPGVGAMYNGQLFKGLIHVVIFAVLVSITDRYGVFGIFIGAWVLYQSFEAYHTARARRDGTPIPDPFGLNEVGSWLNLGSTGRGPTPPPPPASGPGYVPGATDQPPYSAPYSGSWAAPGAVPPQPPYTEAASGQYSNPEPYSGAYPPGTYPPGYIPPVPPIPPIPPVPPYGWRRREPVWAVILIALGIIFLLQSLGVVEHMFHYAFPVLMIGLGVWLIVRRLGYSQGGPK
jgi:TM2 domain-containing membrane protein YozV